MDDIRRFYDIHCHAMNLSHPNFSALLKRINRLKFLFMLLYLHLLVPLSPKFRKLLFQGSLNLLSLMENDIASFFLITEYFLRKDFWSEKDGALRLHGGIGTYHRLVLTPLIMDFGYKQMERNVSDPAFYNIAARKPIAEQVIDVFNGIRGYMETELVRAPQSGGTRYAVVPRKTAALFEIYPFLGLNTANYSLDEVNELLQKYFGNYRGTRPSLFSRMGRFDGNIDEGADRSHYFAGIKLYPPLGFDPWPDEPDAGKDAMEKVNLLYRFCERKKIPITVHCSDNGFQAIGKPPLQKYTSPERWDEILRQYNLKINFAHLGKKYALLFFPEWDWEKKILDYIARYDGVYADFANCPGDWYYGHLKTLIDESPDREKLRSRLLFGSDFPINLLDVDSYNEYLQGFGGTPHLTDSDKELFCSVNPERFLFHNG